MNRVTLITAMSALRQKLSELFSAQRAPAGYQPGRTLGQLQRNLGLARFEQVSPTLAHALLDDDSLHLEIRERTESQLLMHLVMTEFSLRLPASAEGAARFELHHAGPFDELESAAGSARARGHCWGNCRRACNRTARCTRR